MTEKETAEAIIIKHAKVYTGKLKPKWNDILQHARFEVEAILNLPIFWSESGSMVAHHNGIESTQEFWQCVLSEIK